MKGTGKGEADIRVSTEDHCLIARLKKARARNLSFKTEIQAKNSYC